MKVRYWYLERSVFWERVPRCGTMSGSAGGNYLYDSFVAEIVLCCTAQNCKYSTGKLGIGWFPTEV